MRSVRRSCGGYLGVALAAQTPARLPEGLGASMSTTSAKRPTITIYPSSPGTSSRGRQLWVSEWRDPDGTPHGQVSLSTREDLLAYWRTKGHEVIDGARAGAARRAPMTPAEKIAKSKRENYHPGISRVTEDGSPRRGWMFCSAPDCIEVVRRRNGPLCVGHLMASREASR